MTPPELLALFFDIMEPLSIFGLCVAVFAIGVGIGNKFPVRRRQLSPRDFVRQEALKLGYTADDFPAFDLKEISADVKVGDSWGNFKP